MTGRQHMFAITVLLWCVAILARIVIPEVPVPELPLVVLCVLGLYLPALELSVLVGGTVIWLSGYPGMVPESVVCIILPFLVHFVGRAAGVKRPVVAAFAGIAAVLALAAVGYPDFLRDIGALARGLVGAALAGAALAGMLSWVYAARH